MLSNMGWGQPGPLVRELRHAHTDIQGAPKKMRPPKINFNILVSLRRFNLTFTEVIEDIYSTHLSQNFILKY